MTRTNTKTVMILNAPPNTGKDYIAELMCKLHADIIQQMFKDSLYAETAKFFDVPEDTLREWCADRFTKEQSSPHLGHRSPREALIYASEDLLKPVYGRTYFGDKLAERVHQSPFNVHVVSDGGFEDELTPLYDAGYKVILVRMERKGCDFGRDSRRYLSRPDYTVYNNGNAISTVNHLFDILHKEGAL